jgi:quinol monooxygenase YgiN
MAIFRIGRYSVRPEGITSCQQVIHRTVALVTEQELTTLLYRALQDTTDPTRFVHISAYTDEEALQRHIQGEVMLKDFRENLFPFIV